jgi:hypothetical protein
VPFPVTTLLPTMPVPAATAISGAYPPFPITYSLCPMLHASCLITHRPSLFLCPEAGRPRPLQAACRCSHRQHRITARCA